MKFEEKIELSTELLSGLVQNIIKISTSTENNPQQFRQLFMNISELLTVPVSLNSLAQQELARLNKQMIQNHGSSAPKFFSLLNLLAYKAKHEYIQWLYSEDFSKTCPNIIPDIATDMNEELPYQSNSLLLACERGDENTVLACLDIGCPLQHRSTTIWHVILFSAHESLFEKVRDYLKSKGIVGPDINLRTPDNRISALDFAIARCSLEFIQVLLDLGAQVTLNTVASAFANSIRSETLEWLCENGLFNAFRNKRDYYGKKALDFLPQRLKNREYTFGHLQWDYKYLTRLGFVASYHLKLELARQGKFSDLNALRPELQSDDHRDQSKNPSRIYLLGDEQQQELFCAYMDEIVEALLEKFNDIDELTSLLSQICQKALSHDPNIYRKEIYALSQIWGIELWKLFQILSLDKSEYFDFDTNEVGINEYHDQDIILITSANDPIERFVKFTQQSTPQQDGSVDVSWVTPSFDETTNPLVRRTIVLEKSQSAFTTISSAIRRTCNASDLEIQIATLELLFSKYLRHKVKIEVSKIRIRTAKAVRKLEAKYHESTTLYPCWHNLEGPWLQSMEETVVDIIRTKKTPEKNPTFLLWFSMHGFIPDIIARKYIILNLAIKMGNRQLVTVILDNQLQHERNFSDYEKSPLVVIAKELAKRLHSDNQQTERQEYLDMLTELLQKGITLTLQHKNAACIAAEHGDLEVLNILAKAGQPIDKKIYDSRLRAIDYAAIANEEGAIEYFQTNFQQTPLEASNKYISAYRNRLTIKRFIEDGNKSVESLCDKLLSIGNLNSLFEMTPLFNAVYYGKWQLVNAIAAKQDISKQLNSYPYIMSVLIKKADRYNGDPTLKKKRKATLKTIEICLKHGMRLRDHNFLSVIGTQDTDLMELFCQGSADFVSAYNHATWQLGIFRQKRHLLKHDTMLLLQQHATSSTSYSNAPKNAPK